MAHKHGARKRWKQAIAGKIEAVPGTVVKSFSTLVYRLRGEGYQYDQETDFWYYITNPEERDAAIEAYRKEREEAKRETAALTRQVKEERRRSANRGQIKLTTISA
ncbi:MAG TPA: hypothetical protein VGJ00_03860 [Rhabdochlamydiaceae bacterium]|jgi:predicted Zn-dependent peptidase